MTTSASQDSIDAINVVNLHFQRSDAKDFAGARALWTNGFTVDFGGVNPTAEGVVSAEGLERSARTLVGPFAVTQHMITKHVVTVEGDAATAAHHNSAEKTAAISALDPHSDNLACCRRKYGVRPVQDAARTRRPSTPHTITGL